MQTLAATATAFPALQARLAALPTWRRIDDLFIEVVPITYDQPRWHADFLAQWPSGSPANESYWKRISEGQARASNPEPAWP